MTDATPQDIQIHAAIDLGASSGRVIAGWIEDGKSNCAKFIVLRTSNSALLVTIVGTLMSCSLKQL